MHMICSYLIPSVSVKLCVHLLVDGGPVVVTVGGPVVVIVGGPVVVTVGGPVVVTVGGPVVVTVGGPVVVTGTVYTHIFMQQRNRT